MIGPSNPIASIGPILAVPGMREALADADAPVVAVSPLVGGRSLKGPTERSCVGRAGGRRRRHRRRTTRASLPGWSSIAARPAGRRSMSGVVLRRPTR